MTCTRTRNRLGVSLGMLMLVACAGQQTRIDGKQFVAVADPAEPKNIMLVLAGYSACTPQDQACKDKLPELEKLQARFESCISRGLRRTGPHVMLMRHEQWGDSAELESIIEELVAGSPVSTARLAPEKIGFEVDYLVSIGVKKSSSEKEFMADVAAAHPGTAGGFIVVPPTVIWAFGQEWTNSAMIRTRIFSANTGKLAGELSAALSKDAYWVLPVITIIPLVPVGSSPDVETKSCKEMGEALGRFFSGAGNQHLE